MGGQKDFLQVVRVNGTTKKKAHCFPAQITIEGRDNFLHRSPNGWSELRHSMLIATGRKEVHRFPAQITREG
jgi:hypothetical protein